MCIVSLYKGLGDKYEYVCFVWWKICTGEGTICEIFSMGQVSKNILSTGMTCTWGPRGS